MDFQHLSREFLVIMMRKYASYYFLALASVGDC